MLPSLLRPAASIISLTILIQTTLAAGCAKNFHMVFLRGQGPGDDWNVLTALRDVVLNNIPGTTVHALDYPHENPDHFEAAYDGALQLQGYIENYVKACPTTKLGLFGYSLGAVTAMNAVCGTSSLLLAPVAPINSKYNKNIIGIIGYGDETFVPMMSWNTGTCTVGTGLFPRLNPLSCDPFEESIQSYCDQGDKQCCAPGTEEAIHHQYFKKYDGDVVAFLKNRLATT